MKSIVLKCNVTAGPKTEIVNGEGKMDWDSQECSMHYIKVECTKSTSILVLDESWYKLQVRSKNRKMYTYLGTHPKKHQTWFRSKLLSQSEITKAGVRKMSLNSV